MTTFGTIITNRAQEMVETGSGDMKRRVPKYTIQELLDPAFLLPREGEEDAPLPVGVDGAFFDEVKA